MTDQEAELSAQLESLKGFGPAGYALALHVRFTTPTLLFQTYPVDWIAEYSQKGMVMQDPTVHWGFENTGAIRWTDLADRDEAGVLKAAAGHGLNHGVTVAVDLNDSQSLASFARPDREYSDAELEEAVARVEAIHKLTASVTDLTEATRTTLRDLSVAFSRGA